MIFYDCCELMEKVYLMYICPKILHKIAACMYILLRSYAAFKYTNQKIRDLEYF